MIKQILTTMSQMIGQITKLADTKMRDVRWIELSDCNYDNVCGDGLQTTPVFKQHFFTR